MTLESTATTTHLSVFNKGKMEAGLCLHYYFHGERHLKFEHKIAMYLRSIQPELPFLFDYRLVFTSGNNFPHSAGIASSASSMAAIALCLVSLEEWITKKKLDDHSFFQRASRLARLGSGSASRSVYGGLVSWGTSDVIENSSDDFATPFPLPPGSRLGQLRDIILIVSSQEKAVSSSHGHAMMKEHPYREGRNLQAQHHMRQLTEAIRNEEHTLLAKITENEALSLHALLLSSSPAGILLHPNTINIIREIRDFRDSSSVDLFFTLDAGPNVHLLFFDDQREAVLQFVRNTLSPYCESGVWIEDKIGKGPVSLTPKNEGTR
jgi:diphosphomevalonate decarboxylase